jgi:hypothetical protein
MRSRPVRDSPPESLIRSPRLGTVDRADVGSMVIVEATPGEHAP